VKLRARITAPQETGHPASPGGRNEEADRLRLEILDLENQLKRLEMGLPE
ncbi:unnamed protein product, partial [marine sediment metagenome]